MTSRQLERRLRARAARDPLLRELRRHARLWLVGGYVRDAALGRPAADAADIDLLADRGTRRIVRALEARWRRRAFGFRRRGVTTWRFDVGGRRVDLVDADRRGLTDDLWRRELTINAVAFELATGRLADPLGGLADLRAGRLRPPRPGVFAEDPIRALRSTRFLAQLPEFRLHREASSQARAVRRGLGRASVERVREELDRLLGASAPRRGLDALRRLGLLEAILPELEPLGRCTAGRGRPDVWQHTLDAIGLSEQAPRRRLPGAVAVSRNEGRRLLRWALLLHDIAKPETLAWLPDGRPSFHGHEVLGARRAETLLRRLRLPKRERRRVGRLILFHLRPGHLADAGAPTRGLRRLVREIEADLPLLVLHAGCDARASGSPDAAVRWRRLRAVLEALLELGARMARRPAPALLDGRDVMRALGLEPGPAVGRALRHLEELQHEGQIRTREQALEFLAAQAAEQRS